VSLALAAALSTLLAACGVGVGGTGTGEDLTAFGATRVSVCAAPIASALSCTGTGANVEEGTSRRLFVDTESNGRVLVTIDGNVVTYEARCRGLSFNGTWGRGTNGVQRFFGSVVRAGDNNRSLALLDVALPNSGLSGDLVVWLKDANEQTLVPAQTMRAVASFPATLPACPL
jgi:hypothetical protein